MKNLKYLLFFPLFLFGAINGKNDYQVWQRVILNVEAPSNWELWLTEETRFGDDVTKLYFTYLQALFAYKINQHLYIAPGYRQIYKRSPLSSTQFKPEYSPMIDVVIRWNKNDWKFNDRNRVQYLIFGSNPSHWQYRNKFQITTPWKVTTFQANPYIEDEVFFRENEGFVENRASIGFHEEVTKHVNMDFFYIARYLKASPSWVFNNVFGFNIILNY